MGGVMLGMRSIALAGVVAVSALLGASVAAAPARAAVPSGVLTGTVSLGATSHLAGAGDVVVTLERFEGGTPVPFPGVSAVTDANGVYTFTGLEDQRYNLIFDYRGDGPYLPHTTPYSSLFPGSTFDVTLPFAYVVAGRVSLDVEGAYAGEGEVRVTAQLGNRQVSTLTEADGTYNLGRLGAFDLGWTLSYEYLGVEQYPLWHYTGDSRGADRSDYRVLNTADRYDYDVVVGAGVSLSGRITMSDGEPVVGITVRAFGTDPVRGYVTKTFAAVTDQAGNYRIRALPNGWSFAIGWGGDEEYSTGFAPEGHRHHAGGTLTPGHDQWIDHIDGVAYRAASARAELSWPASTDAAALIEEAQVLIEWWNPRTARWSDPAIIGVPKDGHSVLAEDLAPGRYRLSADALGGPQTFVPVATPPFDLLEGQSLSFELTLLPRGARPGVPVNMTPPTVSGLPHIGSVWNVDTGTWTESPAISIFWLRCESPIDLYTTVPPGCTAIPGAHTTRYEVVSADAGKYLTAQIAATGVAGFSLSGAVSSTPIDTDLPRNVVVPRVQGNGLVGSTWELDTGSWSGSPPPQLVIAWLRCSQAIVHAFTTVPPFCSVIPGAATTSYTTTPSDVGAYVTAQVAGNSPLGFALAGATNITRVVGDIPVVSTPPSISGSMVVGTTVLLDLGEWTGEPSFAIAWLRCDRPHATVYTTVPADCVVIRGSNSVSYTLVGVDAGKYISAQVAGNTPYGFTLAGAPSTQEVAGGVSVPRNIVPPALSGAPLVATTLVLEPGEWTGSPTLAIAWLRCDNRQLAVYQTVPPGCTPIPGANATTYLVTRADTGKYLTAQVAGNGPAGFSLAGAISTDAIISDVVKPVNMTPPTVSGAPSVGSVWTVDRGTWFGIPTFAIAWLRCADPQTVVYTTVPAGCTPIAGATGATYVTVQADVGKYLTAQVAGNSEVGFSLAGAVNAVAIEPPNLTPVNLVPPSVSGTPSVGSVWTVDTGSWTGSPSIVVFWLRCVAPIEVLYTTVPVGCDVISGANGTSYVATPLDVGRYLTAQVGANGRNAFALSGAINTSAIL
jgi:hypothetical protein